jgi:site-specific DNA-methyltransferase (cytosine-N4-specific)
MIGEVVCRLKPYIQPFERALAIRELVTLAGAAPIPEINSRVESLTYRVDTTQSSDYLAERLTYWERLHPDGNPLVSRLTRQVRREATTSLVKNGITPEQLQGALPFRDPDVPLPNRRNLRYGPHGIHEYRGKFFPQLVRALLNIAGSNPNSLILDPMCGSGTTPTEAILLGCRAIGLDLNPLSVLISQTKCKILTLRPEELVTEYQDLKAELLALPAGKSASLTWFDHLSGADRDYLAGWFAPQILAKLDPIARRVNQTPHPTCRALFQVVLSNILRRVSWQKDDDLRVRKEIRADVDIEVMSEFLAELNRSVRTTLALLYENQDFPVGQATILEGDARRADQLLADRLGGVDVIITSPPYATALPYLDTDRLSLCYLGLLSRPQHRSRDHEMIGNREITDRQRQLYWQDYQQNRSKLPAEIVRVIELIDRRNSEAEVGFRRRNLAALLARYFLDMRQVFETFVRLLKPGAPAYVVVGNNHTLAGGQRVAIETDKLLAQLGESVGLRLEETLSMEMLVSRDVFKENTGSIETILFFRMASKANLLD